jgi:hypothetical protein
LEVESSPFLPFLLLAEFSTFLGMWNFCFKTYFLRRFFA